MKICQIIPYGGEDLWIKLALREFPETRWLIILANKPKMPSPAKYSEIKDKQRSAEKKNYYEEAKALLKRLKEEEEVFIDEVNLPDGLPIEKRKRYSLLEPINLTNFYELLRYFRALLQFVINEEYKIIIHLNSGPMIWRICLYLAAAEFRSSVELVYLFEKVTGERQDLWIYRDLTDQEKFILEILSENLEGTKLSISEIQELYLQKTGVGTLSYILKIIKGLVTEGLLSESKEGRTRWIELTELGSALTSIQSYKLKFEEEF